MSTFLIWYPGICYLSSHRVIVAPWKQLLFKGKWVIIFFWLEMQSFLLAVKDTCHNTKLNHEKTFIWIKNVIHITEYGGGAWVLQKSVQACYKHIAKWCLKTFSRPPNICIQYDMCEMILLYIYAPVRASLLEKADHTTWKKGKERKNSLIISL